MKASLWMNSIIDVYSELWQDFGMTILSKLRALFPKLPPSEKERAERLETQREKLVTLFLARRAD
jgi:hypothetical protein